MPLIQLRVDRILNRLLILLQVRPLIGDQVLQRILSGFCGINQGIIGALLQLLETAVEAYCHKAEYALKQRYCQHDDKQLVPD